MLCVILLLIRISVPYFITPDDIRIENIISSDSNIINRQVLQNETINKNQRNIKRKPFNPNQISFEGLIQLGFPEKTARIFLKFRSKGFVFRKKEDLKKVYGVTDQLYKEVSPYVILEPKHKVENAKYSSASTKNKLSVELNLADSLALLELNGVGPSYAKRILKYRNLLGGFTSINQLKEVYGFTDELYEKLKPNVTVNASLIKKLDINNASFKEINKHPYISYELTKSIFNRSRKESITPTILLELTANQELFEKLNPYILY
ncbi:MAG: helix-hairpin-helix domain-containing protein [Sphingobacteriaceae bacterium]|nr:helix-hairpin-helix domain-containing protein [Sphingobacteriaceae bacterium]